MAAGLSDVFFHHFSFWRLIRPLLAPLVSACFHRTVISQPVTLCVFPIDDGRRTVLIWVCFLVVSDSPPKEHDLRTHARLPPFDLLRLRISESAFEISTCFTTLMSTPCVI